MKYNRIIKCLVVICTLLFFAGCEKEKTTVTEYIGRVVEGSTMNPLPNVKVAVTNGNRVLASTITDEEGAFSFLVNFDKVSENDSLLLDGNPLLPYQKKYELKGMGKEQYDYRDLVLYNQTDYELKTFQYAGTTYYVHPEVGAMNWESAMDYCENLTFEGYSDWFLPDKYELNALYVNRNSIGGFVTTSGLDSYYWSSTRSNYSTGHYGVVVPCYWGQSFNDGRQSDFLDSYDYYRVRPIRKD